MTTIPVLIDHRLRVSHDTLPEGAVEHLVQALEIPNVQKAEAKRLDQWGWQRLPDTIPLWGNDGLGRFTMPRGFLGDFATGMSAYGYNVELVEHRNRWHHTPIGRPIHLRSWQESQVEAL